MLGADLIREVLWRNGLELGRSHRNHENRRYEGSPPQGPSRGTAGQFRVLKKILPFIDPPRGRPFGGGGVHLT